jgi:hypothetical protein
MTDNAPPIELPNPGKEPLEEVIDFVTGMVRSVRMLTNHEKVYEFKELVELYAVLPKDADPNLVIYDVRPIDIEYNLNKLPDLVAIYESSANPYALKVIMTIIDNALAFSRPIPEPMVGLLRKWFSEGGPKRKKEANPLLISRDQSLVAAVKVLSKRAGISPTRSSRTHHEASACDIAARIWNEVAAERIQRGESWPSATYSAAEDAWKASQRSISGQ